MRYFSYNRIFNYRTMIPIVYFGCILFVTTTFDMLNKSSALDILLALLVARLLLSAFKLYQSISGDLIDEVYDDFDSIVLVRRGRCERVLLSEIINVNYQVCFNCSKVTFILSHNTRLGSKVSFSRPTDLLPVMSPKKIEEFILRVDETRRKS